VPAFGTISYGIAALAFLALTLLLAVGWQGRGPGIRLVAASGVTALWAAAMAYAGASEAVPLYALSFLECARNGAWLWVLTGLTATAGVAPGLSRGVTYAWLAATAYALLAPTLSKAGYSIIQPDVMLLGVGFGLALAGLILLEQIYRNSRGDGRHALKYLVIALGTMWAYDLFLYSQAQLLHAVDAATWNGRGLVFTLIVPLIAIAARRNPQWSLDIFVSRQVVFYTTSLLAIGSYLLLMAFGGYAIRLYGGTWGRAMQLAFLAGAAVVLLALVASGSLRRRLRVFLSKHFYRNKYDYRIEWLRFINTLSASEEGAEPRETSVRAIAQIIGSPGGVLYLRREGEAQLEACAAWPREHFRLGDYAPVDVAATLPVFLESRQWVIDLEERAREPDLYDNLDPPAALALPGSFRFVLPLLHGASLLGFVALRPPPPPFSPTYEDRDLLKTVGRHVATHIAQHEADRRLAENRQFEAYHRLTAFLMHDLKNVAAQLSLIVTNAERHKRNPEFVDDAISTVANAAERMQRLIEQLQGRGTRSAARPSSLVDLARRACERAAGRKPVPQLVVDGDDRIVAVDAERFVGTIEHLLRNAQDATPATGAVTVRVCSEADTACLEVSDTGAGMTTEFVERRLFKPFDSTKGSKGMGIGAYQVREYIVSLGGNVRVTSAPGAGATFTITLPVAPPTA